MSDETRQSVPSDRRGRLASPAVSLAVVALVVGILLVTGVMARLSGKAGGAVQLTELAVGFDKFPHEFLGYEWRETALDENTERILGAMHYLRLDGLRPEDSSVASLLVTYFGQSYTMVEHEPEVCMVKAGGWDLPYGIIKATIPIPATEKRPAWNLPVNVYLFQKDVDRLLLVNTYCVAGTYTNNRDDVRILGKKGEGFYAQTRVTIHLGNLEWSVLAAESGGPEGLKDLARDAERVTREIGELRARLSAGERARGHPYIRAAEIMRYVIPHLEAYLPMDGAGAPAGGK